MVKGPQDWLKNGTEVQSGKKDAFNLLLYASLSIEYILEWQWQKVFLACGKVGKVDIEDIKSVLH